jgi:hypothetical protein
LQQAVAHSVCDFPHKLIVAKRLLNYGAFGPPDIGRQAMGGLMEDSYRVFVVEGFRNNMLT